MTEERSKLRKKWKKEVSAGGLVFKKEDGRYFVLMIMPRKRDLGDTAFTPVWTFPKGWVGDHGEETLEQSALREVREEGGVNGRIIQKLDEVKYFFQWQGEKVFKTVHWFLMEYESGNPEDHDHEVEEARWFEVNEAKKTLSYKSDLETLEKAHKIISLNS